MQTTATPSTKQSDTSSGVKIPSNAQGSNDMLTRAHYGIHVTGRIDAISELNHRQGQTQKGSAYSFWQQSVILAMGGTSVEVVFRSDSEPKGDLIAYELDQVVKLKVENPRIFNGKTSFDISK